MSNRTPSFKFDNNSKSSFNNTVSNIIPLDTHMIVKSESKAIEDDKNINNFFSQFNNDTLSDENIKVIPMLKKIKSNYIFTYDTILKKNSYGTEYTKLSSSIQSGNHTWYDSKASSNNTIKFNVKSNTINEKKTKNSVLK